MYGIERSGLLVAAGGMFYVLLIGIAVLAVSVVHLAVVRVEERRANATTGDVDQTEPTVGHKKVDLHGTLRVVRGVPGLVALIAFSCFSNFLGGTYMALMDAYGPSLISVQSCGHLHGPDSLCGSGRADDPSKRSCRTSGKAGSSDSRRASSRRHHR